MDNLGFSGKKGYFLLISTLLAWLFFWPNGDLILLAEEESRQVAIDSAAKDSIIVEPYNPFSNYKPVLPPDSGLNLNNQDANFCAIGNLETIGQAPAEATGTDKTIPEPAPAEATSTDKTIEEPAPAETASNILPEQNKTETKKNIVRPAAKKDTLPLAPGVKFTNDRKLVSCKGKHNDHRPSPDKKNHYDEDCCIDRDEWLQPGCTYHYNDIKYSLNGKKPLPPFVIKK